MRRIALGSALLILLAACAPVAPPTPTVAPPRPAQAAPTATAAMPSPTPAPGPSPTPRPSPSPAAQKPPSSPQATAGNPAATKPDPAATAGGGPAPGTRTAAAGPAATPVRVGGAPAQQVAVASGKATFATGPGGLYRLDGAQASLVKAGPPPPNLRALDADRLVSGQAPGCMRDTPGAPLSYSRDGGKTWEEASGPTGRGFGASPHLVRGEEVFALYCAGVLWSQDGGKTYAAVTSLSPPNFDPWDLALAPDGSVAYLTAVSEGGTLEVSRSTRSGKVWAAAAHVDQGWGHGAIAVGPDGRVFLGTAVGVKASVDRGATWQSLRSGLEDVTLSGDPTQGNLSAADQQKLRAGAGINDLAFLGATPLAATPQGIYRLSGSRWERWSDVTGRVERLEIDQGTVYAHTGSGVVALRG